MPPKVTKQNQEDQQQQQQIHTGQNNNNINLQLLRDLEFLRNRRHALENEIQSSDIVVFDLETKFLELTGTPVPVSSTSSANMILLSSLLQLQQQQKPKNVSGVIRTRDGKPASATTSKTNKSKSSSKNEKKSKKNQSDDDDDESDDDDEEEHFTALENHMSALRFGDACELISSNHKNNIKTVHSAERMFSLTNYSSLAACGKHGIGGE